MSDLNGHRIVRDFERPSPELLAELVGGPLGLAGPGTFGSRYVADRAIRPLRDDFSIHGPAFTVLVPEPDHLIVMYAIELAQPGDVLVVDAGGRTDVGVWGWSMAMSAMNRGLAGVVVDGAVVDSAWLRGETPFAAEEKRRRGSLLPVFSRGPTPCWATWEKPGSINVPVTIGGLHVEPGDLVSGDADGLVIVPQARIAEALPGRACFRALAQELDWLPKLRDGDTTWFRILGLQTAIDELALPETDRADGGS